MITDYADNLQRIGTIIAALDVANATGVEVIRLQHAIATDLAPLVTRLIEEYGVAVLPGTTFGAEGCRLRVAYGALKQDTAEEGIGRLTGGLAALLRGN